MPDVSKHKLSFDEFKLYYESTEKVTDRRIDTNRWNYTVCIAMLVSIALIVRWSLTTAPLLWVGFTAVSIICVVAVLFCVLWIRQIHDFKNLNTAKFEVLNEMAPSIEFSPESPGSVVSFRPFEKEWRKMNDLKGLNKIAGSRVVALKSTRIEYFLPQALAGLFVAILLALGLVAVLHWPPTKLVQPPASTVAAPEGQRR